MMRTMKKTTTTMMTTNMLIKVITLKELDSGPSLTVRGGFGGDPEPVHFEDEYEDLNAYRER